MPKPNQWRVFRETDDGCAVFQCLPCKATWEARTSPREWTFCPACGTRWAGAQDNSAAEARRELRWEAISRAYTHNRLYQEATRVLVVIQRLYVTGAFLAHEDYHPQWQDFQTCNPREIRAQQVREILERCRRTHPVTEPGDESLFRLAFRRPGLPDQLIPWRATSCVERRPTPLPIEDYEEDTRNWSQGL